MREWFRALAKRVSDVCATWQMFILNCALIVVWLACGPVFDWSEAWQLIVNTGTTIVTFLLVFLLLNTQARDTAEMRLKIDELILANDKARNALLKVDKLPEEAIQSMQAEMTSKADV